MRDNNLQPSRVSAASYRQQLSAGFDQLRFSGVLEPEFRAHYAAQNLPRQTVGMTLVAVIYLVFLVGRMSIETANPDWPVYGLRLAVIVAFASAALMSYGRWQQYQSAAVIVAYLVFAVCVSAIEHIADPSGIARHYEGLIFFTIHVYVFGGLVLRRALLAGLGIFFINLAIGIGVIMSGNYWEHRMFLLLPVNLLGAVALYQIEFAARENYLQRHLLADAEKAQTLARERERILGDMHDGLGGILVSTLSRLKQEGQGESRTAQAIQQALTDLRLLLFSLDPGSDSLRASLAMLRDRLLAQGEDAGLSVQWRCQSLPDDLRLTRRDTLQLMRILQEAFTNCVKHAQASEFSMQLDYAPGSQELQLTITDNGIGLVVPATAGGQQLGIANMQARARQLGADIQFVDAAVGTRIEMSWRVAAGSAP